MFNSSNPQIYVSCLAAYNNGIMFGDWIDANQSADDIHEAIQTLLKKSPIRDAEEWAIHDYQNFGDVDLSEYESINTVADIAAFIEEYGEIGSAVLNHANNDLNEAKCLMEEGYQGEYESEEDFAYTFYNDCYDIPFHLENYIDYQAIARDLFLDGYFSIKVNYKVHVFCEH